MNRLPGFIVCIALLLSSGALAQQAPTGAIFNIQDFGAIGDGTVLNTEAIQRTIDSCAVRGGTVIVPPGRFLTGSIELRSNLTLFLQAGAVILGSTQLKEYRPHTPSIRSYNDYFLLYSLFYAEGKENIRICGDGTIDGQGGAFKVAGKEKPTRYKDRPYIFRFVSCSNVRVDGLTLQNSAMWMQHYFACENVTIKGIRVFNHSNKNNDMMDIDGCRNVTISDCIGDTDDDGITLKSTSERITENVAITNCVISSHCNAIKTGTESTGGFKNIVISNCVVKPSAAAAVITGKKDGIGGIVLTNVDGGVMESISISNIVIDGTEVPIFIRLGNRARRHYDEAPVPPVGGISGVSISNVRARNVNNIGCSVTGIPGHRIEGITLDNISITFAGGVSSVPLAVPAELEDSYPESTMWGVLPSYGFFVRHAQNIVFRNCTVSTLNEDIRSAFMVQDTRDLSIDRAQVTAGTRTASAFSIGSCDGVRISNSSVRGGAAAGALVGLVGTANRNILILHNDVIGMKHLVSPAQKKRAAVVTASGNIVH